MPWHRFVCRGCWQTWWSINNAQKVSWQVTLGCQCWITVTVTVFGIVAIFRLYYSACVVIGSFALHVALYELPQQKHKVWMWMASKMNHGIERRRRWQRRCPSASFPFSSPSLHLPLSSFTAVNDNTLSICWIPFRTWKFQLHLSQKEIIKVVAGFRSLLKCQHVTMGRKCVFHSTFRDSLFIQTAHSFIHSCYTGFGVKLAENENPNWIESMPQQFQLKKERDRNIAVAAIFSYLSLSFLLLFCLSVSHSCSVNCHHFVQIALFIPWGFVIVSSSTY